ncbi:Benzyl alcohol O-benzoyltransferase [Bienertia sinuspersici]
MTFDTQKNPEIPDCYYPKNPILVTPDNPTPKHSLYLSNLDDQKFLRFSIKYLYLYEKGVCVENLKLSLSKILTEYYPLAGRLRSANNNNDQKLEVDCNGEGALFAEAYIDYSVAEFLEFSGKPNKSWRKLLYKVDALTFLDVPPLVVQVSFSLSFRLFYVSIMILSISFHPIIVLTLTYVCGSEFKLKGKQSKIFNIYSHKVG